MKRIAVIGAGSWGTALAVMAGRAGHEVRIWARNTDVVNSINQDHINGRYLTDVPIPQMISAANNLGEVLAGADFVILAVPAQATREILKAMAPLLQPNMILVSAAKGIEVKSGKRLSEVTEDVLKQRFSPRFVCLSGPSFAREVVDGHPTAIVAASLDMNLGQQVQTELSFENLRLYTNDDLPGTEIGGSVKNIMAIAAGMVSGLGFGSNSLSALITRGLAETRRFAVRAGARVETLMGLAGLGDLVLTCTGLLSRNRFVGQELGRGRNLDEIIAGMPETAEGVATTEAVRSLAIKLEVEMPITEEVFKVLYEGKSPRQAVTELMNRPLRGEL
jgi:glycerol-3-phosphate dehydrogenase (NAD(P)+)